jgi:hypothetical protein
MFISTRILQSMVISLLFILNFVQQFQDTQMAQNFHMYITINGNNFVIYNELCSAISKWLPHVILIKATLDIRKEN